MVKAGLDRTVFTNVLLQIREGHPEEREQEQVDDTFALYGRTCTRSRTELLRHGSRRVLMMQRKRISGRIRTRKESAPAGHSLSIEHV